MNMPMSVTVTAMVLLALAAITTQMFLGQTDNVNTDTNNLEAQGCDFQVARANERSDLSPGCRDQFDGSQSSGNSGPSQEQVSQIESTAQNALDQLESED